MLRNKSTVTSSRKQALMADYGALPSSKDIYRKPKSSIFLSPRLFSSFSSKGINDTESLLSPTSILDGKPFSVLRNPFWSDSKIVKPETRPSWDKLDSRGVGLGIVDALKDDKSTPDLSKPDTRMVLFGSQLKIQIPQLPPSVFHSQSESPKSPADFGIKTRNAQVGRKSPPPPAKRTDSRSLPGFISASDMELSEDYTRVISHGPNPKTTHIFDDCIVESCCGVVDFSATKKESDNGFRAMTTKSMSYPSESFLSFCYGCKKNLGHGKDIYIYRGEKAFCSCECRQKEMMLDEEEEHDV
ncbi:FCS-Like Zinc finger 8 [Impatiens glandulifera]|uniref:FCS-Like Zinc finger 8 n=1 Tax=Impatiens glandulifera TaxID=253017 RepID=UPI001FB099B2|nr:FCS-Like Zinc finger 8 [Impatiens glandulifera]